MKIWPYSKKKSGNSWTYGSKEFFKYLLVTLQTIQYDWFLLNPLLCLGILAPVRPFLPSPTWPGPPWWGSGASAAMAGGPIWLKIKINLTKSLIRQDLCLKCIFMSLLWAPGSCLTPVGHHFGKKLTFQVMSLCYSDSMRHKWPICKINISSIFILTYKCLKTALQNISGGSWPNTLCGSISLKGLFCKSMKITKMWFQ